MTDLGRRAGGADSPQDVVNRRVYDSALLVMTYARRSLRPAEQAFIYHWRNAISHARVLELGMGGGRITRHLVPIAGSVVGVDVSPAMVSYCRRTLRSGSFFEGDLRNLSQLADDSQDVVVAGANVLDALDHEDRLQALTEVRRVLVPGGLFYFSAHNRNSARALREATQGPTFRVMKNPYRQARATMSYIFGRVNHPRYSGMQRFEHDYAILNDDAHAWRLLHYYIDRNAQARQLAESGFRLLEVIGVDGRTLEPDDDDSGFTELHYVATRD